MSANSPFLGSMYQDTAGMAELEFFIQSMIGRMQTTQLVQVAQIKPGGTGAVGFVSVRPMVSMMDGNGNVYPHGVIHNIPYFRLQGGGNAVIIDPQVGDIGLCMFCSHDISAVKTSKKAAAPASLRRFDFSDGLYIGGVLNGVPKQYLMMSDYGVKVYSASKIELNSPEVLINSPSVQINGNTTQNGSFSQTGGGSATFSGDLGIQGSAKMSGNVTATDGIFSGKSFNSHTNGGLGLD